MYLEIKICNSFLRNGFIFITDLDPERSYTQKNQYQALLQKNQFFEIILN